MSPRSTPRVLYSTRILSQILGISWPELEKIAGKAPRLYHSYDVRRVDAKKWRHIDNPANELKEIQSRILKVIQKVELPPTMTGAIPGRSIFDHASPHVGQPVVATLDVCDFFPRTSDRQVFRAFRSLVGCSEKTASVLTKLTTLNHRLPQGAPTSPFLANLTVLPLHEALVELTGRHGLAMTMYIDDIAVSGLGAESVLEEMIRLVMSFGHSVRANKTKVMKSWQAQSVTGQIVNSVVGVSRDKINRIRGEITEFKCRGVMSLRDFRSVMGKISFVMAVSKKKGGDLLAYAKKSLPTVDESLEDPRVIETRECASYSAHRQRSGFRTR